MGRLALIGLAAALAVAAAVWAMRGRAAPDAHPAASASTPSAEAASGFPLGAASAPSPAPIAGVVAAPAWIVSKDDVPAQPAAPEPPPKAQTELARYQREWTDLRQRARRSREELVKNHDRDGDGDLNREEAREARRAMRRQGEAAREEFMNRFDADGDGELSDQEQGAMRRHFRAARAALAADDNEDGVLDPTETALVLERIKAGNRRGDLNGDGQVDAADAALLLEWTKGR